MVFFGVWWSWMNFSWFASAYDNDDVAYRLLVLIQLTGALIFAAGIPRFEHGDRTVGVAGYVVMRLALVTLWRRAARGDAAHRDAASKFARGVLIMQVLWVAALFLPANWSYISFFALATGEVLVPLWAERQTPTAWHPEHIAERYGLFTLITLGESILAASIAVRTASDGGASFGALWPILVGGLLIVFCFWWLYFENNASSIFTSTRSAFAWGYSHYLVFGSAGAVGAGLATAIDAATHKAHISKAGADAAVAVPVAVFLSCLWFLHGHGDGARASRAVPSLCIAGILLSPLTGQGVLVTGILIAVLTATKVAGAAREGAG